MAFVLYFSAPLAPVVAQPSSPAVQTPPAKPLPIEAVLPAQDLRLPVVLSPDGEWAAYALRDTRKAEAVGRLGLGRPTPSGVSVIYTDCAIYLTNTANGKTHPLINDAAQSGTCWGPSWSPSGKQLAFYSDRAGQAQVWVWERKSGAVRRVSDVPIRSAPLRNPIEWTPDGRHIVVRTVQESAPAPISPATSPLQPATPNTATVSVFRSGPASLQAKSTALVSGAPPKDVTDLTLLDIATGSARRLARNVDPTWYRVLPGGKFVAFLSGRGNEPNTQNWRHDLYIASLTEAHAPRLLKSGIRHSTASGVSCSPDGTLFAVTEFGKNVSPNVSFVPVSGVPSGDGAIPAVTHPPFCERTRAPVWDTDGKNVYVLAGDALWQVNAKSRAAFQVASLPGETLVDIAAPQNAGRYWSPSRGKHCLVLLTRNDASGASGFYQIDLSTNRAMPIWSGPAAFDDELQSMSASEDGRQFVFAGESAQSPLGLWKWDALRNAPRPLTNNAPKIAPECLGKSRLVSWKDAEGHTLRGALLLPPDYRAGKRYPLIVNVYGGARMSEQVNQFGLVDAVGPQNMQLYASRGYAVLAPDTALRVGTPMKDIAGGVLPGVDKLVELGIADPDRIGVMGFSYGGYSTLALITQSPRFKAAICYAGFGNLIYGPHALLPDGSTRFTGWVEAGQGRMGGSLWEFRDRYIDNSPFFFLDRVRTPLLIVQGNADPTTPPANGDALFLALSRLGQEVEYAKYDGEGHGLRGYANQKDACQRMIDWFDKHLK